MPWLSLPPMRGKDLSDVELLAGVKIDAPGMFESIFNRHWEALYRHAYQRLQDQQEAEDLVQDIFADLWERRHTLEITASLRTYLLAALKYKLIKRAARADLQQKTLEQLVHRMARLEDSVLDLIAAGEINRTLEDAVRHFPENMRNTFRMRAEECSVAEIAKALGLSEQTVKNNTSDALRRLRGVLAEKHPEIPPTCYLLLGLFIKS